VTDVELRYDVPDGILHPVVENAARGILPDWTCAGPKRRDHMTRVAKVLDGWARARGETPLERARWVASGYLHDSLRDAEPETLRGLVDGPFHGLAGKILHGPAAARRLEEDGVEDDELLHAVRYHTLGSAGFASVGMALYSADYLEPGRGWREDWRAKLRDRAVEDLPGVVQEILASRIGYLIRRGRPVHPETLMFWNRLTEGEPWAGASEF
jgi:2-amino-4-hydroxy-6-hydroxymethyldihydropteridine diphosphokinase